MLANSLGFDRNVDIWVCVPIVFPSINHGDGRHVDDNFDSRGALQNMDRPPHSHQDRPDELSTVYRYSKLVGIAAVIKITVR